MDFRPLRSAKASERRDDRKARKFKPIETAKDVAQRVAHGLRERWLSLASRLKTIRLHTRKNREASRAAAGRPPQRERLLARGGRSAVGSEVDPLQPAVQIESTPTSQELTPSDPSLAGAVEFLYVILRNQMRQVADRLTEHGCLTLVAHRSVYEAMDRLEGLRDEDADSEQIAEAEADLDDCRTAWAWADILQLAYRDAYMCLGDVFDENNPIAVKYDIFKEALAAQEEKIASHPDDYAPWEIGEVRKWMASVNANPNVLTQQQSPTYNKEKHHGI